MKAPIFLTGHPRSGTTLLQCMLSAHSGLTSLPETHFFSRGLPQLGLSPTGTLSAHEIERLLHLLNDLLPLDVEQVMRGLDADGSVRPRAVFEQVVLQYTGPTASRLVEKTPIHALFLPQIQAAFPEAVFIHLVRDPRDVIHSARRMPIAVSQSIPFYIESWNRVQRAVDRFRRENPASLCVLKYEELTAQPEKTLQEVCSFLGLAYESAMVDSFAEEYARNVLPDAEGWKQGVRSGEVRSSEGKWRNALRPGEAWLIESGCRRYMAEFGYAQVIEASFLQKAAVVARTFLIAVRERRRPLRWLRNFTAARLPRRREAK